MNLKSTLKIFIYFMILLITSVNAAPGSKIQLALLLDTSNSMDGLIHQAKSQLWKIVNEFALARYQGEIPDLEIAIYEYGNNSISARQGHVRLVSPLSNDLDELSERLFQLRTNGGNEYCGEVIYKATDQLKWDDNPSVLKVIFIAGNEPFNQGETAYKKACREAIQTGIIINTIFCGNHQEGISTYWKNGADLADGNYTNIDHNQEVAEIDAPQDKEIHRLNQELNKTYIGYGQRGNLYKLRQKKQDLNAQSLSKSSATQRIVSKSSANYKNTDWDLVDATEEGTVDLEKIKKDDLPKELQAMSPKKLKEHVAKQQKKRTKLQQKIKKLNKERRKHIATQQKKQRNSQTLDSAIIQAIHKQAAKKNFIFTKE